MITKDNLKINLPKPKDIFGAFHFRNWVLTICFFLVAFSAAVYVWWQCIQVDTPRQHVVEAFNQNKDDFEQMSQKVSGAIKQLQERKEEFEHAKDYSGQREMFRMWEQEKSEPVETGGQNMPVSQGSSTGQDVSAGQSLPASQPENEHTKVIENDTQSSVQAGDQTGETALGNTLSESSRPDQTEAIVQ